MTQSGSKLWWERARRARGCAYLLRGVPFLRLVGLNGSLVTGTMNRESDIDFYIVTAADRLYLTRALVTLVVHLTGWRRYGDKIRGRICLNRFATVEALEITPHDDYHARVFSGLVPLWAVDETYSQYVAANRWMTDFSAPPTNHSTRPLSPGITAIFRRVSERILGGWWGDRLEGWCRVWQQGRIRRDPRTEQPGSRVFIRENELCFHFKPNKNHG